MKRTIITLALATLVIAIGAGVLLYLGVYNVAATRQHTPAVYWLLKAGMRQSIRHHARGLQAPPLDDAPSIARGRALYESHCVRCHGAPGIAPDAFALGLRPLPANLANTGLEWPPEELFWTVKHGIKATGMPGWMFRLPDDALWSIVAFLRVLPHESPEQYRAAHVQESTRPPGATAGTPAVPPGRGDPGRGKTLFEQYACITCHVIPGVVGASMPVGPPLTGMGMRYYIAGVLPNTPANMVRWLREPQRVLPGNAMPDLGVTTQDATDMAAYLERLR